MIEVRVLGVEIVLTILTFVTKVDEVLGIGTGATVATATTTAGEADRTILEVAPTTLALGAAATIIIGLTCHQGVRIILMEVVSIIYRFLRLRELMNSSRKTVGASSSSSRGGVNPAATASATGMSLLLFLAQTED